MRGGRAAPSVSLAVLFALGQGQWQNGFSAIWSYFGFQFFNLNFEFESFFSRHRSYPFILGFEKSYLKVR